MWAFIFQRNTKEKKVFAESHQKAPNFDNWATEVMIRASLKREQGVASECRWENSDSNIRRREFCQKIEGYGRVCHCKYSKTVKGNFKKPVLKYEPIRKKGAIEDSEMGIVWYVSQTNQEKRTPQDYINKLIN